MADRKKAERKGHVPLRRERPNRPPRVSPTALGVSSSSISLTGPGLAPPRPGGSPGTPSPDGTIRRSLSRTREAGMTAEEVIIARQKREEEVAAIKAKAASDRAAGILYTRQVQVTPREAETARTVSLCGAGLRIPRGLEEENVLTCPSKYRTQKFGSANVGQKVQVLTNYAKMIGQWDAFVVLFDVQFSPDEPNRAQRQDFLRRLMENKKIPAVSYVYNSRAGVFVRGVSAAQIGEMAEQSFQRQGITGGVKCTIVRARTIGATDLEILAFLNNLKNRWIQDELHFAMINRAHFDQSKAIHINETNARLILWPGFATAIGFHDGGIMLNIDNRFKVIRDIPISEIINQIMNNGVRRRISQEEARSEAGEEVAGTIAITQYSDKPRTYRVLGIEWNMDVNYKFQKNGKDVSLRDYYQQMYDITIKNAQQPLLLAEETGAARFKVEGDKRMLYLVPELCYPTGLTDQMRENFRLMKQMSDHTLQAPELRASKIYNFMGALTENRKVKEFLDSWKVGFGQDLARAPARILQPVQMVQGLKKFSYDPKTADWTRDIRSGRFHLPFENARQVLFVYPKNADQMARAFWGALDEVGRPMGLQLPREPLVYAYTSDRDIMREVREFYKKGLELVIVILPAKTKGRYDEIKYALCRELPVISQCIVAKTLEKQAMMKSVATKIAIQMGAKMGGAPWGLDVTKFTFKTNIMIVGVDTYHDSGSKGGSRAAVAVVGTLDNASTEFATRVFFQSARQEISDELGNAVGYLMDEYKTSGKVGRYPDVILFYRDGVGAGQLNAVTQNEVAALRRVITGRSAGATLVFIVVTKRHSTRFMLDRGQNAKLENPPPGTIVDTVVTKPNRMDFYICAQTVRQGTVSPTYYNVLYDDTPFSVDQLQQMTYAQCCMYFNWSGTVKVPAQCQYAHKLAFLVGQSIHDLPAADLSQFLYFL